MIAWTVPRKMIKICPDSFVFLFVSPKQKIRSHNSLINFAKRGFGFHKSVAHPPPSWRLIKAWNNQCR